jgi:mono/diheme cytochrome c family protein
MNKIFKAIASLSGVALISLTIGACSSNPDSAGLEYMPDMYRSPAIEPYVDYGEIRGVINDSLKGQLSALTPPMRTIPYYGTNAEDVMMMLPYNRKPSSVFAMTHGLFYEDYTTNEELDYEYNQASADKNPIRLTAVNSEKTLATGKNLYEANCVQCHGAKGDGEGSMVTAGSYVGVANLVDIKITDGQMFYSIYYGKGMMGAHRSLVNKKEIWTLIHYIHKLQNADYGSSFDVSGLMSAAASVASDSTKTVK